MNVAMRPPVVCVDRDGWLVFFGSIAEAERGVEQTDIENREYLVYDASGARLVFELEAPKASGGSGRRWKRLFPPLPDFHLVVRDLEGERELRRLLLGACAQAGFSSEAEEALPLDELLARATKLPSRRVRTNPAFVGEIRQSLGYGE
jgi:hypothetical protein